MNTDAPVPPWRAEEKALIGTTRNVNNIVGEDDDYGNDDGGGDRPGGSSHGAIDSSSSSNADSRSSGLGTNVHRGKKKKNINHLGEQEAIAEVAAKEAAVTAVRATAAATAAVASAAADKARSSMRVPVVVKVEMPTLAPSPTAFPSHLPRLHLPVLADTLVPQLLHQNADLVSKESTIEASMAVESAREKEEAKTSAVGAMSQVKSYRAPPPPPPPHTRISCGETCFILSQTALFIFLCAFTRCSQHMRRRRLGIGR